MIMLAVLRDRAGRPGTVDAELEAIA